MNLFITFGFHLNNNYEYLSNHFKEELKKRWITHEKCSNYDLYIVDVLQKLVQVEVVVVGWRLVGHEFWSATGLIPIFKIKAN